MPPIFKALATTMAWVLWIVALVTGFSALAMGIISRDLYNSARTTPMVYPALFAVAGFLRYFGSGYHAAKEKDGIRRL